MNSDHSKCCEIAVKLYEKAKELGDNSAILSLIDVYSNEQSYLYNVEKEVDLKVKYINMNNGNNNTNIQICEKSFTLLAIKYNNLLEKYNQSCENKLHTDSDIIDLFAKF